MQTLWRALGRVDPSPPARLSSALLLVVVGVGLVVLVWLSQAGRWSAGYSIPLASLSALGINGLSGILPTGMTTLARALRILGLILAVLILAMLVAG